MSSFKIPYYDKRKVYSNTFFTENKFQKYIALFLSNPSNYSDIYGYSKELKEPMFMSKFIRFLENYIVIDYEKNFDSFIYFNSLNVDKKGSINICGGGGKMSNSAKKQFKDEYSKGQMINEKLRKYLSDKYKIDFSNESHDPRLFIGHHNIWNNPSPELLKLENWTWVVNKSYDDVELIKPFPDELDPDLIPLTIRNKVLQKFENEKRKKYEMKLFKMERLAKQKIDEIDKEEEEYKKSKCSKTTTNTEIDNEW